MEKKQTAGRDIFGCCFPYTQMGSSHKDVMLFTNDGTEDIDQTEPKAGGLVRGQMNLLFFFRFSCSYGERFSHWVVVWLTGKLPLLRRT